MLADLQEHRGDGQHLGKNEKLSASSADEGKAAISKTDAQTRIEKISAQSTEVMSGLVVISTSKKPIGKGGEVQVTIG